MLVRITCMPGKGHTQYGSKISIKIGHVRQLQLLNCALSLVSHLLMDELIIGTFTHPYTSNNTFLYAKPGCAMKNRGTQRVKKLTVCKDSFI